MIQFRNARCILRIISVQIFLLTMINAEILSYRNVTKHDSTRALERLKRAPFHRYIPSPVLTATIIDGDEEIHLRWERVDRYLFNENLPVYTAQIESWGATHKKSNVMKNIGKTIIYHDIAKKSAVIYSENTDQLNGVIGQSYLIELLPMDKLSQPLVVSEGYVRRLPNYRIHENPRPNLAEISRNPKMNDRKKVALGEASSSNVDSHENSERFYIETLLFITYDMFKFWEANLNILVFEYLIAMSAVDMVFAMLPTNNFELYINVAGIIIEEEDGVFSKILHYPPLRYDNRQELHNDGSLFDLFRQYPDHSDFPFVKDSFDLMLIATTRDLVYENHVYQAWNSGIKNIFQHRRKNQNYSPVPSIMVRWIHTFSQYPTVINHMGEIFGLDETRRCDEESEIAYGDKCYSIMQDLADYCTHCITWSEKSIGQLEKFFSKSRNRCFYLNKPRSLYPAGTPVISISPCRQCTCFGYVSYAKETPNECPFYISPEECGEPLLCNYQDRQGQQGVKTSILPLDGTPCGENKVCWTDVSTYSLGATCKSGV